VSNQFRSEALESRQTISEEIGLVGEERSDFVLACGITISVSVRRPGAEGQAGAVAPRRRCVATTARPPAASSSEPIWSSIVVLSEPDTGREPLTGFAVDG
jgi:hypothetical protein